MFGSAVAAPLVGMGFGVFEQYARSQQPKPDADAGASRPVMGDWVILRDVAEAASDLDAVARDAAREPDRDVRVRERRRDDPARSCVSGAVAIRSCRGYERCERPTRSSRTQAVVHSDRGSPIQRMWRDAHAARAHVVNSPNMSLAAFGTGVLGGVNFDMMGS